MFGIYVVIESQRLALAKGNVNEEALHTNELGQNF